MKQSLATYAHEFGRTSAKVDASENSKIGKQSYLKGDAPRAFLGARAPVLVGHDVLEAPGEVGVLLRHDHLDGAEHDGGLGEVLLGQVAEPAGELLGAAVAVAEGGDEQDPRLELVEGVLQGVGVAVRLTRYKKRMKSLSLKNQI